MALRFKPWVATILVACVGFGAPTAWAQDLTSLPDWAQVRTSPPRKALVLGIGAYKSVPTLATPPHDRALVGDALGRLGFAVSSLDVESPTRDQVMDAVDAFASSLSPGDVAVVYYSGHGVERGNLNYLVPADAVAPEAGREAHVLVGLSYVTGRLEQASVAMGLVVLDACRTDPFVSGAPEPILETTSSAVLLTATPPEPTSASPSVRPRTEGLKPIDVAPSLLVGFAAAPGKPAYSLRTGETADTGSLYTRTLATRLGRPGKFVFQDLADTSRATSELTQRRQNPWMSAFAPPDLQLTPDDDQRQEEEDAWIRLVLSLTPEEESVKLRDYLAAYPATEFSHAARRRLTDILSERMTRMMSEMAAVADIPIQASGLTDNVILDGALKSLSFNTGDPNAAVATGRVALFGTERPRLGQRALGFLEEGDLVRYLDIAAATRSVQVVSAEGLTGFVRNVEAKVPETVWTFDISFSGPEDREGQPLILPSGLADRIAAEDMRLTLDVGPAGDVHAGRASQLAYARALAVRQSLVDQGVPAGSLDINLTPDAAPSDIARLTLSRLDSVR